MDHVKHVADPHDHVRHLTARTAHVDKALSVADGGVRMVGLRHVTRCTADVDEVLWFADGGVHMDHVKQVANPRETRDTTHRRCR